MLVVRWWGVVRMLELRLLLMVLLMVAIALLMEQAIGSVLGQIQ